MSKGHKFVKKWVTSVAILSSIALSSAQVSAACPETFPLRDDVGAHLHSHNDFAQEFPLTTALENKITSVEADVTDRRGEVRVVHLGLWTYGTLKEMYLDRLQKIVDEKGSVYGDGKLFTIWIEFRPVITGENIVPLIRKLLANYPMLAVYSRDGKVIKPGPVQAVLMNVHSREVFDGLETAPACLTVSRGVPADEENAPFQCFAHYRWESVFNWTGQGEMPKTERAKLDAIQADAHRRGIRTRYWGVPEGIEFWKKVPSLPFDLIGSDQLKRTMDILTGKLR